MSRLSLRHSGIGVQPKWNKPAFTPRPQNVTSLWLVGLLISHSTEGRRLGWPGWLGEILRWFTRFKHPKTVTHPSGGGESNWRPLSRKSDALTRRQSHYSTGNTVLHNLLFNFVAQLQIDKLEIFLKCSTINAGVTILLKTLFSSVYSVIIYIENLTDGKVIN